MSPEQAAGRTEEVSQASDIYSLGATLYSLLTGKEPFEAKEIGTVLEKVRKGEFIAPRTWNRSVPPALNAVCLKAMKLSPGERYPSCATLASDLEHWLADEPVTAFREPWTARSARWIKRHRGVAAGSAALLAALIVGLAAGTMILSTANIRIESQRAETVRQLYVSQMNLAQRAWDDNNVGRAREIGKFLGHDGAVLCVVFSRDGRQIITGSKDETIRIWDVATQRTMRILRGHSGNAECLSLSADGMRLASCSNDATVRVWGMATGQEVYTLKPDARVYSVSFGPDSLRLAAGCDSGRSNQPAGVAVWDARPLTDELRAELTSPDLQARIAAQKLVESLFATRLLKADVLEAIRMGSKNSETVRTIALDVAERWPVDPTDLNNRSWSVVKQTKLPIDQYQLALRYIEAACEQAPEIGYLLNTLGIAQYRVGDYMKAMETLSRSDELNIPAFEGSIPADIAFLAMTQHHLGHADEAARFLRQLRQLLESDRWKSDAESQAFLKEAEELIPASTAAPAEANLPTVP